MKRQDQFELNRLPEQEDINYFEGAGLCLALLSKGPALVWNSFGGPLSREQAEIMRRRGYYAKPIESDTYIDGARNVERKPLEVKNLEELSRKELDEGLHQLNLQRGRIQSSLEIFKEFRDWLNPLVYEAMIGGCESLINQLDKDSYAYMDAILYSGKIK